MSRPVDPQRWTLPIDLLNYAHNSLMKGWGRHGDLQETFHIYMDIIDMAIDAIERLSMDDEDAQLATLRNVAATDSEQRCNREAQL